MADVQTDIHVPSMLVETYANRGINYAGKCNARHVSHETPRGVFECRGGQFLNAIIQRLFSYMFSPFGILRYLRNYCNMPEDIPAPA
jgi:hypothetical protein